MDALVREVLEACSAIGPISQQQALRLVLGMGYNKESAVSKWRDVDVIDGVFDEKLH